MIGIIKKLVQRRIRNKKDFFLFFFFEELLRVKFLREHVTFGMILFTFEGIFVQIKNFSTQVVIQSYIS